MHPLIRGLFEAMKRTEAKSSKSPCPKKGRIDILKDFKVTPDLLPTFVFGDEKFCMETKTLGIIVNQSRWTSIYRSKITGEIWK